MPLGFESDFTQVEFRHAREDVIEEAVCSSKTMDCESKPNMKHVQNENRESGPDKTLGRHSKKRRRSVHKQNHTYLGNLVNMYRSK